MITTKRWTVADVELLPPDGNLYEVIDGELHMSTQPDWRHQHVISEVIEELGAWSRRIGGGLVITSPGVIFSENNAVAPDVVWVSTDRFAEVLGDDGKLHAAPDLVVEVLSPGWKNEQRDRESKLALYSRRGVPEYWIVDWRAREVTVYRRAQDALRLVATFGVGDVLESPLLPGFQVPIERIVWQPAPHAPS